MPSKDFQDIKSLLLKKKAILLKAGKNIDKEIKIEMENRHGDDADIAESAYEQEMSYIKKSRGQDEVRHIDEALGRIDKGEYGVCAECDAKILKKRLAVQPYTILCVDCQEQVEQVEQKENKVFPR